MNFSVTGRCALFLVQILLFPTLIFANDYYVSSRAPLVKAPYNTLPLGSVKPRTWLLYQLEKQKTSLTAAMEDIFPDIGNSPWKGGTDNSQNANWENGPYYLKGLLSQAYTLEDSALLAKTRTWVEYLLTHQRSNGDFGPQNNNWWPNMLVLYCLRDYYEVSKDSRVLPFIDKYLKYQQNSVSLSSWAHQRGGDNIDIVLWYYNVTGESYLLTLADKLNSQTADWEGHYKANSVTSMHMNNHIVNFMQGIKKPAVWYLRSGSQASKDGFNAGVSRDSWHFVKCGRVDDLINGTEHLTNRSPSEGVEMCAIAERIMSNAISIKIMGYAFLGDQLEKIAYNSVPANLDSKGRGYRYYLLLNQPKAVNVGGTTPDFGFNQPTAGGWNQRVICPGPHSGFMCCRCNYHWAWPKFVQSMWMATDDNGLATAAYGPCEVKAKVGKTGTVVTINELTDYPFRDKITLKVSLSPSTQFPLEVRIPEWCVTPVVTVNGANQSGMKASTFFRIDRTWNDGDSVCLNFPMLLKKSHWINNSVAIERGPLIYALKINQTENDITTSANKTKYGKHYPKICDSEILPTSAWNYALNIPDLNNLASCFSVIENQIPADPFTPGGEPVALRVKASKTTVGGWGSFSSTYAVRANEPPTSPITAVTGPFEDVSLVPLGSTQIRITNFPFTQSPTGVTIIDNMSRTLFNVRPGAFHQEAVISFSLTAARKVQVSLLSLRGCTLKKFADGEFAAGQHTMCVDLNGFSHGVYIFRLESAGMSLNRLVHLK